MVLRGCLNKVLSYSSKPFLNDMGWKDTLSRQQKGLDVTDWADWAGFYSDGQEERLATFS